MATKRQSPLQIPSKRTSQIHPSEANKTGNDIPLATIDNAKRKLEKGHSKSAQEIATVTYNGYDCQLIPVEIEKEAELGLVIGQVDGENWLFIDEILPNGMIEMHGVLKEGDYLIQTGNYSLDGVDVSTALLLIEKAFDEGRKTISFVAARQLKPVAKASKENLPRHKSGGNKSPRSKSPAKVEFPREERARSFIEYENQEEEELPNTKNPKSDKNYPEATSF